MPSSRLYVTGEHIHESAVGTIQMGCNYPSLKIVDIGLERRRRSFRRNFLFAGLDSGGEWAASIYILIGSATLNGLDPEFYFATFADYRSQIQDLPLWNLAPSLQTPEAQPD